MSDRRNKPIHTDIVRRKNTDTESTTDSGIPEARQPLSRAEGLDPVSPPQGLYARVPLASFLNGRLAARPFEETRRLFHNCVYAWLLPLDLYRWSIAEYSDSVVVCEKVQRPNRRFALILHARGTKKLTMDALADLERVEHIKRNTFHARAARFNAIFGAMPDALRPFFYYEFEDLRGFKHPVYQMRSGRDYIVVTGPADETPEEMVDWDYFLTPPRPAEGRATK